MLYFSVLRSVQVLLNSGSNGKYAVYQRFNWNSTRTVSYLTRTAQFRIGSISDLDTLRPSFSRMLFNVLPKRKHTTLQVKWLVVYMAVVQKKHVQLFTVLFSSEVPSRLSTNTLVIGERDRSEGLRWRQSPSWCSRSVVSHMSGGFHNLQFINLYKD